MNGPLKIVDTFSKKTKNKIMKRCQVKNTISSFELQNTIDFVIPAHEVSFFFVTFEFI